MNYIYKIICRVAIIEIQCAQQQQQQPLTQNTMNHKKEEEFVFVFK